MSSTGVPPEASSSPNRPTADTPVTSQQTAARPQGVLHQERLGPSPLIYLLLVVFGLSLGVILLPVNATAMVITAVVSVIVLLVVAIATAPQISVEGTTVRAGRAHIDARFLGEPEVLQGEEWAHAMSTGFRPEDFHLTRGWMSSGVHVPIVDPEDPTPGWLLSSRRPEDLALALRSARRAAGVEAQSPEA